MRVLELMGVIVNDGGVESFVFNTVKRMNLKDLKDLHIDYMTPYPCTNKEIIKKANALGGKFFSLNVSPNNDLYIFFPVIKFLKTNKYDVVHIHSARIGKLTVLAAAAHYAGVKKVILHSHLAGEKESIKHILNLAIATPFMKRYVDTFCACSTEAAVWKFGEKLAKKALIVNNGVEIEKYKYDRQKRDSIRKELKIPDSTYVIGHVGRFVYQKNHEFLLEIFDHYFMQNKDSLLLLVGDGENKEMIQKMAIRKHLENHIVFAGSVTNVQDYLQAMDVFVFPSHFEGLPIAVVEAQAAGLPIILSDKISKEVKISDDVVFLSLEDAVSKWGSQIDKFHGYIRKDNSIIMRKAGYDISYTVEQLRNLYID